MASCCDDKDAIRRCIVSGFFFNAGEIRVEKLTS